MTIYMKQVKSQPRRSEAANHRQGLSDTGSPAAGVSEDSGIFYTVYDVADDLQVCTRQVNRWIENGSLIAHRFGRSVRIAKADLTTFLAAHRGGRHDLAA